MLWLEWQFLIFLLPIGLAILYVLMMAFGAGAGDHGVDVGHDVHVDVGHDVHVDVGHDVDHDVHAGDAGHAHHPGVLGSMLSLLGVGKVPLSILLVSAFLLWGGVGVMLNLAFGLEAIVKTIAFAALATIAGTRLIAEGLSSLLPSEESYHTPKPDLVGEVGEVLYEITATSGAVRLCDPSGNLLDLECRTGGAAIAAGNRVVLTDYDPSADVFFVDTAPAGKEILS